tara:strand:- start:13324 stop:15000 length:1677 start_codon:yes stop_codon:yes gene_type:complete
MSKLSLESVLESYQNLDGNINNQIIGLLSLFINSDVNGTIKSNQTYRVPINKLSGFLQEQFYLGDKVKEYPNLDYWYFRLSQNWVEKLLELNNDKQVNLLDLAVFLFKDRQFEHNPNGKQLVAELKTSLKLSQDVLDELFFFNPSSLKLSFDAPEYAYKSFLKEYRQHYGLNTDAATLSFDGSTYLVKSHPGELSRGPFIQTLYSGMSIQELLLITKFDLDQYYPKIDVQDFNPSKNMNNKIFYGAPGTGKSYKLDQILKSVPQEQKERITFHPDFDYASFVGGYKPISVKGDDGKFDIQYKFVPQAFANIYVKAWKDIDSEHKYFLAIEEINRGNCAEIFGDIFQLLDRDANYTVTPSDEFQKFLEEELGAEHDGLKNGLKLPSNLYIYATMNTSDQSLFPMDSAFKRRWDWEYIPICYDETTDEGKPNPSFSYTVKLDDDRSFSWNEFISKINIEHIQNEPTLGMDKCIGNYFIKPNVDGVITLEAFVNKVLFYLWNDVFKDEKNEVFAENEAYESYFPIKSKGLEKLTALLKRINVEIEEQPKNAQEEQEDEAIN